MRCAISIFNLNTASKDMITKNDYTKKENRPEHTPKVDGIMKLANITLKDEHGNDYKPHNPMVKLKKPVLIEKKDSKGNTVYKKDGSPVMVPLRRQGKNGSYYIVKNVVKDEKGEPVMVPKFTRESLMTRRIDFLHNVYVSEQMSHNRSDANSPYRYLDGKKQH